MVLEVSRKVDLFFIKSLEDIYPKKKKKKCLWKIEILERVETVVVEGIYIFLIIKRILTFTREENGEK